MRKLLSSVLVVLIALPALAEMDSIPFKWTECKESDSATARTASVAAKGFVECIAVTVSNRTPYTIGAETNNAPALTSEYFTQTGTFGGTSTADYQSISGTWGLRFTNSIWTMYRLTNSPITGPRWTSSVANIKVGTYYCVGNSGSTGNFNIVGTTGDVDVWVATVRGAGIGGPLVMLARTNVNDDQWYFVRDFACNVLATATNSDLVRFPMANTRIQALATGAAYSNIETTIEVILSER